MIAFRSSSYHSASAASPRLIGTFRRASGTADIAAELWYRFGVFTQVQRGLPAYHVHALLVHAQEWQCIVERRPIAEIRHPARLTTDEPRLLAEMVRHELRLPHRGDEGGQALIRVTSLGFTYDRTNHCRLYSWEISRPMFSVSARSPVDLMGPAAPTAALRVMVRPVEPRLPA